jgi:hypothetical protein
MADREPTVQLRASDADREATVDRLRHAAVEGRIDADELDERLTAAYRARLCTDLERLTADVTPPARARMAAARPVYVKPAKRLNPLAVGSLVVSLLWGWWLGSLAAIVMGHVALKQIARSNGTQHGRRLAIGGLVLGYLALLGLALGGLWGLIWS